MFKRIILTILFIFMFVNFALADEAYIPFPHGERTHILDNSDIIEEIHRRMKEREIIITDKDYLHNVYGDINLYIDDNKCTTLFKAKEIWHLKYDPHRTSYHFELSKDYRTKHPYVSKVERLPNGNLKCYAVQVSKMDNQVVNGLRTINGYEIEPTRLREKVYIVYDPNSNKIVETSKNLYAPPNYPFIGRFTEGEQN